MNTQTSSKEAILKACRQLVSEKGITSLDIRSVAAACDVAVGTIYYYFPSKNELLIATIESVWENIFRFDDNEKSFSSFPAFLEMWYARVKESAAEYPGFLNMHSLVFAASGKSTSRETMDKYLYRIKKEMKKALDKDPKVKKTAFDESFTAEDFIDFVLTSAIALLLRRKKDCATLCEIVSRSIY